jgi:hypothetical protein
METALKVWSSISLALLVVGTALWIRTPDAAGAAVVLDGGVLLLMAMPVVRLAAVIAEEVQAREWRFAALGLAVIALLAGSALVGLT